MSRCLGRLVIDLYPGNPVDKTDGEVYPDHRNQYKPGQFSIIGCGFTADETFYSKEVISILNLLQKGCYIIEGKGC